VQSNLGKERLLRGAKTEKKKKKPNEESGGGQKKKVGRIGGPRNTIQTKGAGISNGRGTPI